VGDVANNFRDTHNGDVLGADDLLLVLVGHLRAAETGEGGTGDAGAEGGDDLGAVGVPRGLAGGEEDARVGRKGDEPSLPSG
jgi:hypothetical protein